MLFSRTDGSHACVWQQGGVGGQPLAAAYPPLSPDFYWGGIWSDGKVFKGQGWIFSKCYYL